MSIRLETFTIENYIVDEIDGDNQLQHPTVMMIEMMKFVYLRVAQKITASYQSGE